MLLNQLGRDKEALQGHSLLALMCGPFHTYSSFQGDAFWLLFLISS